MFGWRYKFRELEWFEIKNLEMKITNGTIELFFVKMGGKIIALLMLMPVQSVD